MTDFGSLSRCAEISDEVVARAVLSHDAMKALLARAGEIARPMEGAARILVALARMATTACTWLEGDLVVEIVGDDEVSVVEVLAELGGGLRERVFPTFTLHVSIDEFVRAVRLVPRMVLPLKMQERAGRLIFSAPEAVRHSTRPPPAIEVEEDFLSIEVTDPESAPKMRARPPIERLVVEEAPPPIMRPSAPKIAPRGESSPSLMRPPSAPKIPPAMPIAAPPKPITVVEERVDRGSSRRMPVAAVAEDRPSAKLPIVPREEDDEFGAFFDDLDKDPPPRGPAEPAPPPPPPPEPKPAPRAASPMLMPRFDAKPKPKPMPRPAPKAPSEAPPAKSPRDRHSQKPTIERMSAIRPEELEALKPAKVPAIAPAAAEPARSVSRDTLAKPTVASMPAVNAEAQKKPPAAAHDAAPPTRRLASKPPPSTKRASKPAPRSMPPTARPHAGMAAKPADEDPLDEGWED
jgi:hypothetical protein